MSCNDVDRLRTESPHSSSREWPEEARRHLESCESCSKLQALLDGSVAADFPEELQQRIEAAILPRLRPVSPLAGAFRVTVALLLCSIALIAAANWHLGVAGWRERSRLQAGIDFSLLGVAGLVVAHLVAQQMTPGARRRGAAWLYLVAPVALLLAVDAFLFGDIWKPNRLQLALSCWEIGVTCAACSAPLFWLVLRKGFTLEPVSHGAATGLLSGLAGLTVLEIYCPYLDRLHISAAHVGAAVTAAISGALWGLLQKKMRRG